MGWTGTIAALLAALLIGFWARAGAARPAEFGRVRYVPYTMIFFASTLAVTILVGQIIRLAVGPS